MHATWHSNLHMVGSKKYGKQQTLSGWFLGCDVLYMDHIYLESHNPIVFVKQPWLFFLLRLWLSGATCVRVATALYGLFSTKCRKNTVLVRVGLSCSFDLTMFLSLWVNKIFYKKTHDHYGFLPRWPKTYVFGFPSR